MAELVYLDTDEQHPYITPEAGTKQYVQTETTNHPLCSLIERPSWG